MHLVVCVYLLGIGLQHGLAANWGAAKSDEECAADHGANDDQYLHGYKEPLIVTGSPEECNTQGCLDGFWGPRSRFKEEPTCPRDLVTNLTTWLREMSSQGAQWATDALILQPCDLWKVMRGRTVWVVGDSMTEDVGHAMSAFMLEYWDKERWEVSLTSDERLKAGLQHGAWEGGHPSGRRTPLWCFQMGTPEDPGRLCYLKADRAKRTLHVLNLLPQLADPEDILLINLGIHYNEMDDLADDMTMVGFALGKYELPRHRIWVETPPQHFETPTGMYNMSRPAKEQLCHPAGAYHGTELATFPDGTVGIAPGAPAPHPGSHKDIALQRLIAGGERNLATQPVVDAVGLPTLRTWNVSLTLHHFHQHIHLPGEGECSEVLCDCTHVCHPSWPQIVMAQLIWIMGAQPARQA